MQEFFLLANHAHAAPAAARGSFDDQRKSNFLRFFRELLFSFDNAIAAGHRGHAERLHFAARAVLFAHHRDQFGGRPNESDVRGFADLREVRVLREKAIAGMNGVHVGDFRGADHLRDVQVTLAAAGRPDANGLIRKAHVQRIAIRFGIDSDGGNTQFFARADDAQRDFPAIGY